MCSSQIHVCCYRNRRLMISLLFLLISNLTQVRFMAEGRTISKLLEVAAKKGIEEENAMMMKLIGSRPPRCDRMWSSCAYCEAIQAPIEIDKEERSHFTSATLSIADSRGEDISNCKPISWKCKCCNVIFNP